MKSKALLVLMACCAVVFMATSSQQDLRAAPQQPSAETVSGYVQLMDTYCAACHSGGLANQTSLVPVPQLMDEVETDLSNIGAEVEIWEKVVRKLGGRMMPPPGMPAPSEAELEGLVGFLSDELDRAAAANPNPGAKALHRINRAEYGNAVRDLLGFEIDVAAYLPADVDAFGFDNIAEVMGTSPALMDRYLSAAWKITAAAIGDVQMSPTFFTSVNSSDLSQNDHIEGLPIGTRGGMYIEYNFPVDGEYVIKSTLFENTVDVTRGLEQEHDFEVTFDGERVKLVRFGGFQDEEPAYLRPALTASEIYKRFETRLQVEAGPHRVGVAFLKKSSAVTLNVLQPFYREHIDPISPVGIPALEAVTIEGPFNITGPGSSPSRQQIFTCYPNAETEERACAEEILTTIARKAYRRPLSQQETDTLMGFYRAEIDKGASFDTSIQTGIAYVLVSPQFLFRFERDPDGVNPGSIYRISDLEMASRLSFFLWSSIPDDELIDLAMAGRLQEPEVLEQQVQRMLEDERSAALGSNFAGQWLYLRNVRSTSPDADLFADFDDNLRTSLLRETEMLFESIVREDRPIVDLLTSDYTFLNERLAKHYGVEGVYGDQMRRVPVTQEYRKGLLGQGSILLINANANRTNIVTRGKYVLTNILGTPPPPPPPNVPVLDEDPTEPQTMRERMEQHRSNPACFGCHSYMDPIGIALENFDAIGRWRTDDGGVEIDSTGLIPVFRENGPIDGPVALREAIVSRSEQFIRTGVEMLMTYGLGRGLEASDMPIVRSIVRDAIAEDFRISSLVIGVVKSAPFQMRVAKSESNNAIAQNADLN